MNGAGTNTVALRPIVFLVVAVGTTTPRLCALLLAAATRPTLAPEASAFVFQHLSRSMNC